MGYSFSPFRKEYEANLDTHQKMCPFCDPASVEKQSVRDKSGVIIENTHYRWMISWYPRFDVHTMIVPKRHLAQLEDETPEEILARHELLCFGRQVLLNAFPESGTEVFLQTGHGSKSTVRHLHWHLFPAMADDFLRGYEKMGHFGTDAAEKEKVLLFPIEIKLAREGLLEFLAQAIESYRGKQD